MYLIVNCATKKAWQQREIGIEDPLRNDPDILFFEAREIPTRENQLEMCFEIGCDSLTGWNELPVLDNMVEQLIEIGVKPEEIQTTIEKAGYKYYEKSI